MENAMRKVTRRLLPTFLLGGMLALLNVAGCVLFLASKPALDSGGVATPRPAVRDDTYSIVACRSVHFWASGDRAEPLWLKIVIVGNVLPVVLVVFLRMLMGYLPVVSGLSVCAQSWVVAVAFLIASTFQWYVVGAILEDRFRRFFNVSA